MPRRERQRPGDHTPGTIQSLDPRELEANDTATGDVLAEIHGGPRRAAHWLRRVLQAVAS
jgi:hypothetical protein